MRTKLMRFTTYFLTAWAGFGMMDHIFEKDLIHQDSIWLYTLLIAALTELITGSIFNKKED